MSNAAVVVPARLDSSRLPNKALLPYGTIPLPALLKRRLDGFDLVFAVPEKPTDDPIADHCKIYGIHVVRGPSHNPLKLTVKAARAVSADVVVRATCDNPMLDRRGVEAGLEALGGSEKPAACNLKHGDVSDPHGYFVDVAERGALETLLLEEPLEERDREHVTWWFKRNGQSEPFTVLDGIHAYTNWAVDTADDYRKMSRLFAECGADVTPEQAIEWCESVKEEAA